MRSILGTRIVVECDVDYKTSKHYGRVFKRFVCLMVLLTLGNFNISKNLCSKNTLTYLVKGSITVLLTSCLTGLDSVALLTLKLNKIIACLVKSSVQEVSAVQ